MGTELKGADIWIPEKEGDKLIGEVVDIDKEAQFGIQATIKTEDGEVNTPSHKWLQNCLRKAKVGDRLTITYEGTQPPKLKGHSPTQVYKVVRED